MYDVPINQNYGWIRYHIWQNLMWLKCWDILITFQVLKTLVRLCHCHVYRQWLGLGHCEGLPTKHCVLSWQGGSQQSRRYTWHAGHQENTGKEHMTDHCLPEIYVYSQYCINRDLEEPSKTVKFWTFVQIWSTLHTYWSYMDKKLAILSPRIDIYKIS